MTMFTLLVTFLFSCLMAPLYLGIINRTKAFFAGRRGQPFLQLYFDIGRLLRKGAVFSQTTTWILFTAPIVGLSCLCVATVLLPFGRAPSLFGFEGDFILFAYLFGLMRFFMIIAALDTGSSFEGMGASREAQFAILTEVALILGISAIAKKVGSLSLSMMLTQISGGLWQTSGGILALTVASLVIVLLAENARIPIDDPNTHLELTMIHEVMVLDHSGPDLGIILYTSSLKFWILGSILARLLFPITTHNILADQAIVFAGVGVIAIVVGIIESCMARLRMPNVPQLLLGASTLSAIALFMGLR